MSPLGFPDSPPLCSGSRGSSWYRGGLDSSRDPTDPWGVASTLRFPGLGAQQWPEPEWPWSASLEGWHPCPLRVRLSLEVGLESQPRREALSNARPAKQINK